MSETHGLFPQASAEVRRSPRTRAPGAARCMVAMVGATLTLLMLASASRPLARDDAPAISKPIGAGFVRRAESPNGASVLEIASRRYRKADVPTEISLVGVVHIATPQYYEEMQRHLDEHGVVLYESVTPRGATRHEGTVEADPVRATRDSMLFLRRVMLGLREVQQKFGDSAPVAVPSIADVVARASMVDSRFAPWVEHASRDAWGRPLELVVEPDGSFLLMSLGADGVAGGEGADADIRLRTPKDRRAAASPEDALQPQLASLLGLAFQLEAIDYDRTDWVVADMGEIEMLAELELRGVDGGPFMRALSGSSLTAGLAGASVGLIRLADGLSGGKIRAFVTLMMIETLSVADERMLARGMPEGFVEVILHRRNDVAYNALLARLKAPDQPKSIAVFYGAAHMPDLEKRLVEDGWKPVTERWFPAMSIDPAAAGLDPQFVAQMRTMLRDMLREMGEAADRP